MHPDQLEALEPQELREPLDQLELGAKIRVFVVHEKKKKTNLFCLLFPVEQADLRDPLEPQEPQEQLDLLELGEKNILHLNYEKLKKGIFSPFQWN